MTNKETAIALLSEFKEKHTFYGKDHERDMNDTFDLAIKALEQPEVKGDLISRSALKKEVKNVYLGDEWAGYRIDNGTNGVRDLVFAIIDNAPTVTQFVSSPTETIKVGELFSNSDEISKAVKRTCKNCKWFRNDQDACYADYYTQHRCVDHSEWDRKEAENE